jgi:hypothetical protein
MQRLTVRQWAAIGAVLLIILTAPQWPWLLQLAAVIAAAVGFGILAWREAGGRVPWLPQRPRVTYWRGRPVPVSQRPLRLHVNRSVVLYGLLSAACLVAAAAALWRLPG